MEKYFYDNTWEKQHYQRHLYGCFFIHSILLFLLICNAHSHVLIIFSFLLYKIELLRRRKKTLSYHSLFILARFTVLHTNICVEIYGLENNKNSCIFWTSELFGSQAIRSVFDKSVNYWVPLFCKSFSNDVHWNLLPPLVIKLSLHFFSIILKYIHQS